MTTLSAVLKVWKKAVLLTEDKNFGAALTSFQSIPDKPLPGVPRARILFNLGCLNLALGNDVAALEKFTETIEKDAHLSIAYLLRGCTYYKLTRYEESEQDFVECHKHMRSAACIDYTQLGLWYSLHVSEALYNAGVAAAQQNQLTKTIDYLLQARTAATEKKHEAAKNALNLVDQNQKAVTSLELMTPENVLIFRPPKDRAEVSVRDHDFLGKAQVIASRASRDVGFTGFEGRKVGDETKSKSTPKSPATSRNRSRSDTTLSPQAGGVLGRLRRAVSPNPPKTQTCVSSATPKRNKPLTSKPAKSPSSVSTMAFESLSFVVPAIHVCEDGSDEDQLTERQKQVISDVCDDIVTDEAESEIWQDEIDMQADDKADSPSVPEKTRRAVIRPDSIYPPGIDFMASGKP